ncbi:hypothetical protein NEOKW01_0425 [Nematocida sp. AWRm80]|nr:hypothetical protein NEOKW01_0425 [Nematocida sp. AWRm80]
MILSCMFKRSTRKKWMDGMLKIEKKNIFLYENDKLLDYIEIQKVKIEEDIIILPYHQVTTEDPESTIREIIALKNEEINKRVIKVNDEVNNRIDINTTIITIQSILQSTREAQNTDINSNSLQRDTNNLAKEQLGTRTESEILSEIDFSETTDYKTPKKREVANSAYPQKQVRTKTTETTTSTREKKHQSSPNKERDKFIPETKLAEKIIMKIFK